MRELYSLGLIGKFDEVGCGGMFGIGGCAILKLAVSWQHIRTAMSFSYIQS